MPGAGPREPYVRGHTRQTARACQPPPALTAHAAGDGARMLTAEVQDPEAQEHLRAEQQKKREESAKHAAEEFAKQPKYIGTIDVHVGGFTVDPRTGSRHLVDHSVAAHGHDASHGSAGSGQVSHGHSQAPGQSEGAHSTAP